MKIRVDLNGTDVNPYHKFALTQNPIPQTLNIKYDVAALQIQKLGGDPIPDTDYIREVLKGFPEEFVELCCQQFKKGRHVTFTVVWDE